MTARMTANTAMRRQLSARPRVSSSQSLPMELTPTSVLLGLAGDEADLVQVEPAKQIEHIDHLLVLDRGGAFQHDREIRVARLVRAQLIFELRHGDGICVQKDVAIVVD